MEDHFKDAPAINRSEIMKHIWRRPRAVFASILSDNSDMEVQNGFWWFLVISGVADGLNNASMRSMGDRMDVNLEILVGAAAFGGVLGAVIGLYLWSWIVSYTNKWIGGQGVREDILTVMGWATFPFAILALFWIPNLALFGMDNFTTEMPKIDSSSALTTAFWSLMALEIVFGIYVFVIWCKGVGVACRFSAWKALGATLLAALILVIPILIIVALIVMMV